MSGWRTADTEAAVRVLTAARVVSWPLRRSALEELFVRNGWTRTNERPSGVLADAGMGLGPTELIAQCGNHDPETVVELRARLIQNRLKTTPETVELAQETFARITAAAVGVFGPPSSRIVDGTRPEVRWRDDRTTLSLVRSNQLLYACARANDWQDVLDQIDAQAALA